MGKGALREIWIIRHGQTAWSLTGQHTSFTDLSLTEEGEREARELQSRLQDLSFDKVFCSPKKRAIQTADLIGFKEYEIEPALMEWGYGVCEGKTSDEIHAKICPDWHIYTHCDITEGAEKEAAVALRIDALFQHILEENVEKVALVTSGHIGRAIGMRWLGLPFKWGKHFTLGTASISILGFEHESTRSILQWNGTR